MSDLQSNRAFIPANTSYLYSGGPYCYALLPPPMLGENMLTFWCFFDGDPQTAPLEMTVPASDNVGRLKKRIKNEKGLSDLDVTSIVLWKLIDPVPMAPEADLAERIKKKRLQQSDKFATKLIAQTENMSMIFSQDLLEDHVYIVVQLPTAKPKQIEPWLYEVHSKIWGRQDLQSKIFRKVEVTAAHYAALQKRLREQHPDRNLPNYNASRNKVLSIKLEILNQTIPASVQRAHSCNEQILVQNDEDLEESDGNDDTEFTSFLPATFKFLDLSSLELQDVPTRLPLPLFIREEYSLISQLLQELPESSNGSAIVSGQPGTGKTSFLHLTMIQYMISGCAFLYQTIGGVVYHVSETITEIESWPPGTVEPIVAFVDADSGSNAPKPFLRRKCVKIIAASSPGGTDQSWLKQGDSGVFVTNYGADLWSPSELFLTGIFLHPLDLTFGQLRESVSYFGYNPRLCFTASQSKSNLRQLEEQIRNKIRFISQNTSILTLLTGTFMTRGVSHSIFELAPSDNMRLLSSCQVRAVSPWALDALLKEYENRTVDAVADFYIAIADKPYAESLRGRLWERQVLKYFETFPSPHNFSMRSLASSAASTWTYPGLAKRATFESRSFAPLLTSAVEAAEARHLVPSDPNFPAVGSILYNPAEGLVCIQVTTKDIHPVAVSGLKRIQAWLKCGTPLEVLRPSILREHWPLIFVVPEIIAPRYKLQNFQGDTNTCEWAKKVDQYVMGIDEDVVWGRAMKTS